LWGSGGAFDGTVPYHFYGELVKTGEGRAILESKGHFFEFARFIREHGLEHEDFRTILKLKSVLWAVVRYACAGRYILRIFFLTLDATMPQGNIGSTAGGLPFLENEDIIQHIVEIAEESQCFSVRG
jgi:rapamycin-insensitive companion of mTOR